MSVRRCVAVENMLCFPSLWVFGRGHGWMVVMLVWVGDTAVIVVVARSECRADGGADAQQDS